MRRPILGHGEMGAECRRKSKRKADERNAPKCCSRVVIPPTKTCVAVRKVKASCPCIHPSYPSFFRLSRVGRSMCTCVQSLVHECVGACGFVESQGRDSVRCTCTKMMRVLFPEARLIFHWRCAVTAHITAQAIVLALLLPPPVSPPSSSACAACACRALRLRRRPPAPIVPASSFACM